MGMNAYSIMADKALNCIRQQMHLIYGRIAVTMPVVIVVNMLLWGCLGCCLHDDRQQYLCFDDGYGVDVCSDTCGATTFPSPSGKFVALLCVDDSTLRCTLMVKRQRDGYVCKIGRNLRSIGVIWKHTQIGDVLIVDNQLDPNMNELYVLQVQDTDDGVFLLYKTPQIPCGERCFVWPQVDEMSYFTWFHVAFNSLSADGILLVTFSWSYSLLHAESNCYEYVSRIPVFYGIPFSESEKQNKR